ncbi:MAG: hypothetical protein GF350_17485, partial [Chitinivibrionales bacterium]|nr:hypothetical protein [Chitinivibrionales bacterium]
MGFAAGIYRVLFEPSIKHSSQVVEWKLNALHKLLSILLAAFLLPLFVCFLVFRQYMLAGIVIIFAGVVTGAYLLVWRKKIAWAIYSVVFCSSLTTLYYLMYTYRTDGSYLLSFNILVLGLFLGNIPAFLWAGIYTGMLTLIAATMEPFSLIPSIGGYFSTQVSLVGESHFSTALFLIWATACISLLFQQYFADLLAKISHTNILLERKVGERTAELNKVNNRLANALDIERELKAEMQRKAEKEKSQMQSELFQAQKMEAVGQLAGGVAHDFNNLLTAITGYAGLLEMKLGEDVSLLNYVQEIRKAGSRAADLTNQLLVFARKGKFEQQTIAIHDIIREVVGLLDRTIDKRIRINLDLDARLSTTTGDPAQVQNALLNL